MAGPFSGRVNRPTEAAAHRPGCDAKRGNIGDQNKAAAFFTVELAVPFAVFHEAVEKSLGRPVYTHEFGMNYDGICAEFLGEKEAPTLEEIINLIPEEKRIIVDLST